MGALQRANRSAGGSPPFPPHVTLLSGLQADDFGQGDIDALWSTMQTAVQQWRQHTEGAERSDALVCGLSDVVTRGVFFQVRLRVVVLAVAQQWNAV